MIKRKCSRPVGNDKLHFGSNRSFRPWKAKHPRVNLRSGPPPPPPNKKKNRRSYFLLLLGGGGGGPDRRLPESRSRGHGTWWRQNVTFAYFPQTIKSAYGRYLDIETGVISGRIRLWVMFWTRGVPLAKILATSRASRTPRKQNRKTEQMKQLSAFPSWKRQTFFYRLRTKKNKSNKKSSKHLEIDNNNNNKRPAVT